MSENEVSETQKLEMQYNELLRKKTQFMAQEVSAYEEAVKTKEKEMANKVAIEAKESEFIVYKERMMKELGLDKQPSIDPMSNKQSLKGGKNSQFMAYREAFLKKHDIKTPVSYGSRAFELQMSGMEGYAFTDPDDGCAENVNAWSPADYYCDMIWQGKRVYGYLAGKITVQGCNIKNGNGGVAQIRVLSARTSQTTIALSGGCSCISCLSNTFTTYTATTDIIGDYSLICEIDEFRVGDVLKPAVIESMSRNIAGAIDYQIWSQLATALGVTTVTLPATLSCAGLIAGSCCSVAGALYNNILRLEATLRGNGYFTSQEPYLLMHPTTAAILKFKEGPAGPVWFNGSMSVENGLLTRIGNIRIIEYPGMPACSTSSGVTIAIMLDPERAVSEIYGKKPFFRTDEDPIECLTTKLVAGVFVAIDELDVGAIGFINTA